MSDKKIVTPEELLQGYEDSFVKDYEIWKETLNIINTKIKTEADPRWTKVYQYTYNTFCSTLLKRMKSWIEHYGYFNEMSSASVLGTMVQLKLRQSEKYWIKQNPQLNETTTKVEKASEISEGVEPKKWFYTV